jgi:large subunit ribosomal protein L10
MSPRLQNILLNVLDVFGANQRRFCLASPAESRVEDFVTNFRRKKHMALTKKKKNEVVSEVAELLKSSKMTVVAAYPGTTVKAIQQLRRDARANGTTVRVVKNRLVTKAIEQSGTLKDADVSALKGQLLYAFNSEDEVAPAQALHNFAKAHPSIVFVGAISAEGKFLDADEVKALAILPGKNDLIAQVIATLGSPLNDVVNGLGGNLHGLLDGIADKVTA